MKSFFLCCLGLVFTYLIPVPSTHCSEPKQAQPAIDSAKDAGESDFLQGRAYLKGEGVIQDYGKAATLLRKAASQGHIKAKANLGVMMANGLGMPKDEAAAVKLYREAAEKGNAPAQNNLGVMLLEGNGCEQNTAEAMSWLKKAAAQELAEAQFHLGLVYYYGKGGEKQDYSLAFPLLEKAALKNHAGAQNALGACYEYELGTKKDLKKAREWYLKSALGGDIKGQSNLGNSYLDFHELSIDRIEAYYWLNLASRENDLMAKKTLGNLLSGMTAAEREKGEDLLRSRPFKKK